MYLNYLADLFFYFLFYFSSTEVHWTIDKEDNEFDGGLKTEKFHRKMIHFFLL